MESAGQNRSKITEIHCGQAIFSAFFTADGSHVLSGGSDRMIRRWQVEDGREADTAIQTGNSIYAAALSMDHTWLVCGLATQPYVEVWNAKTHTKVSNIYGHTNFIQSVDISSNSTSFATGGSDACAFIWSISTGKQLVGPLKHTSSVVAVRFSPDGARLATASVGKSIRIFNTGNGQQLLDIACPFKQYTSSPLAWSADGHQIFAVSESFNGAKCFNTTSGCSVGTWAIPGCSLAHPSIAPSSNQKFIAVTGNQTLSFWDASTYQQIGSAIEHKSGVFFMALSPDDDYVVTGERNGTVTVRSLRDILPDSYFTRYATISSPNFLFILPLIQPSQATFEAWSQGDLSRVERILTQEMSNTNTLNPSRHVQALAQRSLVRSRLKQYNLALEDATNSVGVQRSAIGQIALTIARAGDGEHNAAMRVFDLVFTNDPSADINLVLLIKAIVLFECGRHDEAISRVEDLISVVDDKTMHITVRAQMHLLLANMSLKEGDHERAAELLGRAGDVVVPEKCPELVVILLIFGWNFDGLALAIEQHLHQCMEALEDIGDVAMESEKAEEAISSYSAALSLNPSNLAGLLVKRSRARAMQGSWEDALSDADEAIKSDPQNPWGYERRHAALHALQHYDEAVRTLNHMVSLTENSSPNSSVTQCNCHGGGVGDAALAHVLEDIMVRLGEAAVFAWTGQPSSYNSCLPGTLAIHNQASYSPPTIDDAEMDARVTELKGSMSLIAAVVFYDRVTRLPSTRFDHRRFYLPCILFPVKKLVEKDADIGEEKCYRARVSGIGHVEFRTPDRLSLADPRKLAFVHPWIRDLRGPAEEHCGSSSDDDDNSLSCSSSCSDGEEESLSPAASPGTASDMAALLYAGPIATMDVSTRALRLIVRLQQPFRALLLQQRSNGGYERVAAEHEIVVPGLERRTGATKDVRVEVVEIS